MINANIKNQVRRIANGGFYLALRIGFAYPKEEINELPGAWVEHYTEMTYAMLDPAVRWAFTHTGAKRHADFIFRREDGHEVLIEAKNYGLGHGAVVSVMDDGEGMGLRSYGNFIRREREFSDDELVALEVLLSRMHRAEELERPLTRNELMVLSMLQRRMKVRDIAAELGVSDEAIRLRLKNAREKLDANSTAHAVTRARELGLI